MKNPLHKRDGVSEGTEKAFKQGSIKTKLKLREFMTLQIHPHVSAGIFQCPSGKLSNKGGNNTGWVQER